MTMYITPEDIENNKQEVVDDLADLRETFEEEEYMSGMIYAGDGVWL
jgi:hypothetical protein